MFPNHCVPPFVRPDASVDGIRASTDTVYFLKSSALSGVELIFDLS
jgi:hypothetical protein